MELRKGYRDEYTWEEIGKELKGKEKNVIAFDLSLRHTGIAVKVGGNVILLGFDSSASADGNEYEEKEKYIADLRRVLEEEIGEYLVDIEFDAVVVEGVYGGFNYKVSRALQNINQSVEELVYRDKVIKTKVVEKPQVGEWHRWLREYHKPKGKLKSKYEVQAIMRYLNCPYLEDGVGDRQHEDKLDALGMLIGWCKVK